ncbi:hypothetical protein OIU76_019033 [Salix suchowensis]|nr:hypothetical protein OIU76_019033 [Salix suchowensis]
MAVEEKASVDLGNIRVESSVSLSSNDQDHHIHNNVLSQPLFMKVSQVAHHQAPPYNHHHQQRSNGGESYKREIRELQELFSKLNPMAADNNNNLVVNGNGIDRNGQVNENAARRKKNYGQVKA